MIKLSEIILSKGPNPQMIYDLYIRLCRDRMVVYDNITNNIFPKYFNINNNEYKNYGSYIQIFNILPQNKLNQLYKELQVLDKINEIKLVQSATTEMIINLIEEMFNESVDNDTHFLRLGKTGIEEWQNMVKHLKGVTDNEIEELSNVQKNDFYKALLAFKEKHNLPQSVLNEIRIINNIRQITCDLYNRLYIDAGEYLDWEDELDRFTNDTYNILFDKHKLESDILDTMSPEDIQDLSNNEVNQLYQDLKQLQQKYNL